MRLALSYARGFGARIVQHPEDPALAAGGAATEGELATRLGLPGIPAAAEAILVARDIRLAELTGGLLHFAHVSTAEALDLIRRAKDEGLPITCDTAPPYFDLNETAIGDFRTYAKLSPPLRAEARPAARSAPPWPTAPSTPSPPTTSRATPTTSACPSPWPRPAAPGWRPCSASRWRRSMAAACRSPARSRC